MDVKRGFERLFVAGECLVLLVLLVRPRAVAAIDRAVRIEKEGGEGEIEVELEPRESPMQARQGTQRMTTSTGLPLSFACLKALSTSL